MSLVYNILAQATELGLARVDRICGQTWNQRAEKTAVGV